MKNFIKMFLISSLLCSLQVSFAMQENNHEHQIIYHDEKLLVDAPEIIHSFVQKNVQDIGLFQANLRVKVGTKNADLGWAAKDDTIALPFHEVNSENSMSLINLLQKQSLTAEEREKINLCRSRIQHEGTHIKNNDYHNNRIAQWGIFTSTVLLPLISLWKYQKGPSANYKQSALRGLAGLGVGITGLFANSLANAAYSRYKEQRADNGISNSLEVLQAAANHYRKQANDDEKAGDTLFERYTATHPSNKQRAERFEQRIATLKNIN